MLFTGMKVTFPDGSRFHGLGITPDIASEPTIEDLALGKDTVLLKAITTLQSP
jgi:C-terminal processing protease CtpA/Prc